jgi:hypothetical protein
LVDADHYLAHLSRYIHLNPVTAKITEMVQAYPWSSYPAYLRQMPAPAWLYQDTVLGQFGRRNPHQRYQAFVEAGLDADIIAFYAKQHLEPILGTREFCHQIARLRHDEAPDPEVPEAQRIRLRPPLNEIVRETARHFGVEEDALLRHGKGRGNLPRAVAMALCVCGSDGRVEKGCKSRLTIPMGEWNNAPTCRLFNGVLRKPSIPT